MLSKNDDKSENCCCAIGNCKSEQDVAKTYDYQHSKVANRITQR